MLICLMWHRSMKSAYGPSRCVAYKMFLWDLHIYIYHRPKPRHVAPISRIIVILLPMRSLLVLSKVQSSSKCPHGDCKWLLGLWYRTDCSQYSRSSRHFSAPPVLIQTQSLCRNSGLQIIYGICSDGYKTVKCISLTLIITQANRLPNYVC